ncbi:MAG TPA: Tad domain-containing protein [Rickettsiales bacterium]|nr:Tad domain-containing protein [Rickettsiales bacterium]
MKNKMIAFLKQFRKREDGNVLIIVACALFALVAAAGVAIDMSRLQTTRQKLHDCMDTAGLAAMAKINEPHQGSTQQWVNQLVSKYFYTDCQKAYLGVKITKLDAQLSNNNNTLTLNVTTGQRPSLMPVAGINNMALNLSSTITRDVTGLELVLALDMTDSMTYPVDKSNSSVAKIDALKCAVAGNASGVNCAGKGLTTTGMLDVLYGSNTSFSNVYVSVVPFDNMVNANVTSYPGKAFIDNSTISNQDGCVDARDRNAISPRDRTLTLDISDDRPIANTATAFKALQSTYPGTIELDYCPSASILPPTTSRSAVEATIKKIEPNGNTMINLGLAWSWRLLSPTWTGLWGAQNYGGTSLPLPYGTKNMTKVVVLMTDGINMNGEQPSGYHGSPCCNHNNNTDNAYELQDDRPTNDQLDALTRKVCAAMKAPDKNIVIYTIGFGQADPHKTPTLADRTAHWPAAASTYVDTYLLKDCASGPDHFFLAPTNDQLAAAFQQIANQLVNLRVSK